MFANANIAAGLTVFFATLVGVVVFIVTVFSVNATIISGGFVLTGLVALVVFTLMYRHTARLPPTQRGSTTTAVVSTAHVVLLVTNLIAVVMAPPAIIGALFDPSLSAQVPVSEGAIVASIVTSSVLGMGLLVEKGKRSRGH
jgi:hypothetical protein